MLKRFLPILFTALFIGLSANTSIAQNRPEFDERLLVKFSPEELSNMNQETLVYWNQVVSAGYRIAKNYKSEGSDMTEIELSDWDSPNFNMLKHNLEPQETYVQTFIIKGTDKYIQILSEQKIKAHINK